MHPHSSSSSLKALRNSQRTRSLALSAQSRLAHRAPSFSLSCKKVDSRRSSAWKVAPSLVEAREVQGEKLEREQVEREEVGEFGVPRRSVEVQLAELVCVKRNRGLTTDFEVVPRFKAVIALGDDEFEPLVKELDASSEEDDGWEVVEREAPELVKEVRSWSSVVSRRN